MQKVWFFLPNRPVKSNLGPTPTVQIEKTARCQSLGLHCRKNILSCEGDCSPMSRLNLGKYRQPKNPSTNANVCLFHVAQAAFAKQRPAWARSDDHTGSIVPCVKKTFWVCGLQGSSFDANTKLHKMFGIFFFNKTAKYMQHQTIMLYTHSHAHVLSMHTSIGLKLDARYTESKKDGIWRQVVKDVLTLLNPYSLVTFCDPGLDWVLLPSGDNATFAGTAPSSGDVADVAWMVCWLLSSNTWSD